MADSKILKTDRALKRVCVIGTGCSGIATLRALTREEGLFDVTAFERLPEVGGLWSYAQNEGVKGAPGYFYKGFRTNNPIQSWAFRDLPPLDGLPAYLKASDVKSYFDRYVDTFSLRKYIQFKTEVKSVTLSGDETWDVTTRSGNVITTQTFEFVIICNGLIREKFIPQITGLDKFAGSKIHSCDYRLAEDYTGKRVLIVGTRFSMCDITLLVAKCAEKVYVSGRSPHFLQLPGNCCDRPLLKALTENKAIFEDGSEAEVDDVIFCTGYGDFTKIPFLDESSGLTKKNHFLYPLYNNIVNVNHPTMLFNGYFDLNFVLPLTESVADYAFALLVGKITLPSRNEMLEDIEKDFKAYLDTGAPPNMYHCLNPPRQERFHAKLNKEGGVPLPDKFSAKVFAYVFDKAIGQKLFHILREDNYRLSSDGELEVFQE